MQTASEAPSMATISEQGIGEDVEGTAVASRIVSNDRGGKRPPQIQF